MGNRIKLPNIDFAKAGNTLIEATKTASKFISDHTPEFLVGALSFVTIDNLRVRFARKKERELFEESSVKQQAITRKHEAEINELKAEAEQAQEATKRVDQLEQIVNNITEGGASE